MQWERTKLTLNPDPDKFIYLNFQPLGVVDRASETKGWKLLLFVQFETKHLQILVFKQSFFSNNRDVIN